MTLEEQSSTDQGKAADQAAGCNDRCLNEPLPFLLHLIHFVKLTESVVRPLPQLLRRKLDLSITPR